MESYLIGDRSPRQAKQNRLQSVLSSEFAITGTTTLVSVERCSELLLEMRGRSLSPYSIRKYCRSTSHWGGFQGYVWIKNGGTYQINMLAVYELVARGMA